MEGSKLAGNGLLSFRLVKLFSACPVIWVGYVSYPQTAEQGYRSGHAPHPFERHFIVNFVIKHSGPIKPPKSGPKILVLPFPPISDRARGTSIYQSYIKLHYKLDIPNE